MSEFRKLIIDIAEEYCAEYGVAYSDLFYKIGKLGRRRLGNNGVHLSMMRMCLGFYLDTNFRLKLQQIADIVGYKDHSVLSTNRVRMRYYIENEDPFTLTYYIPLLRIAEKYEEHIVKYRKCKNEPIYEL